MSAFWKVPLGWVMLVALNCAAATVEASPTFRKVVTINAGQVTGGPLTNYPFLFNTTDPDLRTTANGGSVTNANGWDIIFATSPTCADSTSCGGAKLDHEIERYNATTGELVAWVRLPSIDNGTVLYIHYGDSAVASSTENRTAVWDSGYKGVWHLKETPPALANDSTVNANNGTPEVSPVQTAGKIDGSLQFDGTSERDVNVPDNASLQLPTNMTISGWARTTSVDGQARLIVAKWKTGTSANYWLGKLNAGTVNFGVDGGPTAGAPLGLVNDGLWHYVVGVNDTPSGLLRIYVDGSQRATTAYAGPSQTGTSELRIGRSPDALLQDWDGGIDEVRVSNVARSAGWIATEYANQNAPSTFYSLADLPMLTLANHPSGQVGDQFATTTPVMGTLFQFRLSRSGTATVDTLRVRLTAGSGVGNGDVSAGELWEDTNGSGTLDGPDTLLQGSVAPSGGVLTFTNNFSPATSGTNYFVRATAANLAAGDATTFSVTAADIDEVEAGVGESGAISSATHTQDYAAGGDVYYSVGTSTADLKTGAPTISISNGTATLSVAQTGYVGVGDRITYAGGPVFVKAVLSPTTLVVHTATGLMPAPVGPVLVTSIMREFNTIAAAVAGSVNVTHLGSGNLAGNDRRLTWVCYNDGPFNVAATTTISGYTTDATRYITLTVAGASQVVNGVSQRHNGTAGSGAVVEAGPIGGNSPVLSVAQPFTRVEWLEIDGNSFVSQDGIYVTGAGDGSLLRHLIVHDIGANDGVNCASGTNTCSGVIVLAGADSVEIRNCFIYDYGQDGMLSGGTNLTIANTTLFRTKQSGEGLQLVGGTATAENVLAMANTDDFCAQGFCSGTLTCNNCMSSDNTADDFGGTGNVVSKAAANQFRWITGGVDLHLKTGADALNAAKDLSGTFTDDIDGQTRSGAWDVGGDEFFAPGDRMLVRSGVYTGNSTDNRPIFVGFQPDVVFIKRDGFFQAVVRTSTMGLDQTKSMDNAGIALFADRIKAFTAGGFTLGTNPDVNGTVAPTTYYWIAFKAAPGELKVGTYTGALPADNRSVTGVGFQPEFVITLPVVGADPAGVPLMRSSTMPGDVSYDDDASGPLPDRIQAMEADGFQVGSNAGVNQIGATYHYIAWNQVTGRMGVGTYTGNSINPTNHDEVGFAPEWLLIQIGNNSRPWVHKPASTGFSADYTLYLAPFPGITGQGDIQALRPLGFQLGAHQRVNQNPNLYHWIAFGPHTPQINYRSIGTAADLTGGNITLNAGSTTVTKTGGTGWKAANRGRGDRLTVGTNHYMIASVDSNDQLTLATPAVASFTGSSYTIARQFTTLQGWEDCVFALRREHLHAPGRHARVLPDDKLKPRGRRSPRGGNRLQ